MEPHTAERASIFEVKRDGRRFSTRTLKARSDGPANTRFTLLSVHADPRRNSRTCKCVQSKQARSCTFTQRADTYKRSGCSFEVRLEASAAFLQGSQRSLALSAEQSGTQELLIN